MLQCKVNYVLATVIAHRYTRNYYKMLQSTVTCQVCSHWELSHKSQCSCMCQLRHRISTESFAVLSNNNVSSFYRSYGQIHLILWKQICLVNPSCWQWLHYIHFVVRFSRVSYSKHHEYALKPIWFSFAVFSRCSILVSECSKIGWGWSYIGWGLV